MDSHQALRCATALEAMLLRPMLALLGNACEAFGEFGTGVLADAIARHDAGGFAAALAEQLERP